MEDLLKAMKEAIIDGEADEAADLDQKAIDEKISPLDALANGQGQGKGKPKREPI